MLVLGNDAAWGGWGRCLATADGPLLCSHVALGGRRWRWRAMAEELDGLTSIVRRSARDHGGGDRRILVVVEKPPMHYRSATRGRKANEAVVGYNLGQITGSILSWATVQYLEGEGPCGPRRWDYPWEVDCAEWRAWWNIGKLRGGRAAYKLAAITTVARHGWAERHLGPFGWSGGLPIPATVELGEGPCGDVAEAILIAVGAAMRPQLAPTGPRR